MESRAFNETEKLLQAPGVLTYYDVYTSLVLISDASVCEFGFVLNDVKPSDQDIPVLFGFRALTSVVCTYSQTDREDLAIISCLNQFRQFLYRRKFRIYTNHKPFPGILHHTKPIPGVLTPRMIRWNFLLNTSVTWFIVRRDTWKMPTYSAVCYLPFEIAIAAFC